MKLEGERTEKISRQAVKEELVNARGQALPTIPRLARPLNDNKERHFTLSEEKVVRIRWREVERELHVD